MTLQRRMSIAVGSALFAVMALLYVVSAKVMLNGFVRAERELAMQRVERVYTTIGYMSTALSTKLSDWSTWDDSYAFVTDRNQGFVESNLQAESVAQLKLRWILFADAQGQPLIAGCSDHAAMSPEEFPEALRELVREQEPLLKLGDGVDERSGLVRLAGEMYLVASRPSLPSSGEGTPRGALLFVQKIDDHWLHDARNLLKLDLTLRPLADGPSAERTRAEALLAGSNPIATPTSDRLEATLGFRDYAGRPIALGAFAVDRPVYRHALNSLQMLGAVLLAALLTGTLGVSFALRRILLNRLLGIHNQVNAMTQGDQRRRLRCTGSDELTQLTAAINHLLDEVDRAQEQLAHSERRFRNMSDDAPMAVWTSDAAGGFTFLNRAWLELSARGLEEQLGDGWMQSIVEDDRERVVSDYQNHLLAHEPFEFETQIVRPDGERRWILGRGVPQFDETARFHGFLGSCLDITERRELEEHLRGAKLQAEAASRAKSDFLANMSHEIRTPMTAILGYAELLTDPKAGPEERAEHAQTIRRNGEHLLTVINDILDVSKIEAGKMTVESVDTPVVQIVEDVLSLMRVRADAKKLELRADYVWPLPCVVESDPTRLRQILLNLVSNSVKFTEKGSVVIRVSYAGDSLCLDISDSGIGMSPEQQAALFRPFVQADTSVTRKFGGTGLGLTISKRLAELLKGDLTVSSAPGAGSTFSLTVHAPVKHSGGVQSSLEPVSKPVSIAQAGAEGRLKGVRILLAEDGIDNQRLISLYIRKAGGEIQVVGDGRSAVEAALEAARTDQPFDVVLMDMQMPILDGYSAASLLRQKGYAGPVLALTAHSMSDDRDKCIAAGCTDYLTKPINRDALVSACESYARPTKKAA